MYSSVFIYLKKAWGVFVYEPYALFTSNISEFDSKYCERKLYMIIMLVFFNIIIIIIKLVIRSVPHRLTHKIKFCLEI